MYIIYLEILIKLKLKNLINFEIKKYGIYYFIIIVYFLCFNNNL